MTLIFEYSVYSIRFLLQIETNQMKEKCIFNLCLFSHNYWILNLPYNETYFLCFIHHIFSFHGGEINSNFEAENQYEW